MKNWLDKYQNGAETPNRSRNPEGNWVTKYQDAGEVKTYANDPDYFDNRAVFVDNPKSNDLIRSKVYAGTHGWDPTTNSLVKLDKPVAVPKSTQLMASEAYGKMPKDQRRKELYNAQTPAEREEAAIKAEKDRRREIAEDMSTAMQNPYFRGAIPAMLAAPAIAAAGPAVLSALNAPLTIGSTVVPGFTMANAIGTGFAADAAVNRLPQIPGQLSRGEYMDAGVNTLTGVLDIATAGMLSPLYKGASKYFRNRPSSLSSVVDQSPLQRIASSSQNSILGPGFKTDPYFHLDRFNAKKSNILQHLESPEGRKRLQQYINDNLHLNKYSVDDIIDRFRKMTFTTSRPHYRGSDASGKTIYEPWYEKQIDDLIKAGTIDPAYKYDPSTVGPNAGIIIDKNGNLVELNVEAESGFHWAKHGPGNPSVMNIGSAWSPYDAEHIMEHEFGHFFQNESPLVVDHELTNIELKSPFELMQQKSPSYLDVFKDFTSRLNPFTPYDKGYSVTSSHPGFLNANNSARYWKAGSQGMEKTPFAAEIRENLLQRGLIKDRYEPITHDLLRQHHKLYDKTKGDKYRIRLYDVMTKNEDNYKWLSHVLNKMPAAVPVAIGAGALMKEKDGGWLTKYQVGGFPMSFLDELKPYQNALTNEPAYFDEAKQFVTDWHNSPMYNQMVLNSYQGNQKNADYLTNLRKENLRTLPGLNIRMDSGDSMFGFSPAAWSKSDSGLVEVFPGGYEYGPSLYTHEILHSSDRPRELYKWDHPAYKTGLPVDYYNEKGISLGYSWGKDENGNVINYPDWMFYRDPRFPKDGNVWMDRVMPISDQMYITRNRGSNYKDNQDYKNKADYLEAEDLPSNLEEDMKLDPEWYNQNFDWTIDSKETVDKKIKDHKANVIKSRNQAYEKEWKEFAHPYISQPTEVRARLGEIRLNAKKEGIYDPFTEKITPEHFQEYINKKREDSNWQPMKSINELRQDFTDDEILWMLQNISYNDKDDNTISSGKYGGSSKSLNKYQNGSQVKTYANDPSYFDNRAVFVDNPQANDLVRSKVYAGTHGWDPSSNSLVKLDKPVAVPKAVQQMSTEDWGKKSHQERVTSKTPAGKETRKAIAAREMEQAVTNPYFRGAIPAMMLPGVPALGEAAYAGLMSTPIGAATAGALAADVAPGLTVGTLGQGLVDSYFAAKAPGQLMTANQNFRSGDIIEGAANTGLAAMNLLPFYQYLPKAQGPGPLMILDDAGKGVSRAKGDEPHLSEWQKLRIAEGKPVYTGSGQKGNMTMREIQAQKDLQKSVKSKTKPKKLSKEEEYERLLRESYQRNGGSIKRYQDGGEEMPFDLPLREQNPYLVPEYNQPMANGYILPDPNRPELMNTGATEYKYSYDTDGREVQVPSVVAGQYIGDRAFDRYMLSGEEFKPMADPSSYSKFYDMINQLGLMKKKKGGQSQGEGYYDYINGYSSIFAKGGTKGWLDNYK
jgi:hypothetical protein